MKTIFVFDLGGVLIKLNVARCMRAFEALMGEQNMRAVLGMDSNGEGVKSVSIATKQLMADFEKGLISPDEFISDVQQYCHAGTRVDDLRAKGHRVYLLSNGNELHFDFINRTYGLDSHFDGLFLSQKMHLSKPEPQIFEAVQKAIGNPPNVIFIDDIQANRIAAEQTVHWKTYESIDALRLNQMQS